LPVPVYRGATWTTDAPFRETALAIEQAHLEGILAVEMEAAALYAFAQARRKPVVCFAHVTNQIGNIEGDFEKGQDDGSQAILQVVAVTAKRWLSKYSTRSADLITDPTPG
jgi:uridine phosphorylase